MFRFRSQVLLALGILLCQACALLGTGADHVMGPAAGDPRSTLSLAVYNPYNIFDDQEDGGEYQEFKPSSTWTSRKYLDRLGRLNRIISATWEGGPDVLVFVEVEGPRVIQDLHELYLYRLGYRYSAITSDAQSSIQTAVISKLEIHSVQSHTPLARDRLLRSILELDIGEGDRRFRLLATHWKSKVGEPGHVTELDRRAAAALIRRRIARLEEADPGVNIIVAGDLNLSWNESALVSDYPTALRLWDGEPGRDDSLDIIMSLPYPEGQAMLLYSPWPDYLGSLGPDSGRPRGSYFYQGNWLTLDHILLNRAAAEEGGLAYHRFEVVDLDFLLTQEGRPYGYNIRSGFGYSDHLPVLAVFRWD